MIIVKIFGGLGNQMFQYALGRRISYVNNVPLKFDINGCQEKNVTPRKYELCVFNIKQVFASPYEIYKLTKIPKNRYIKKIFRLMQKFMFVENKSYIKEKKFVFDEEILTLPDNIYLEGYWQSEKYFRDISTLIREDFTFKDPLDSVNKDILEKIKNNNSVAIHIRRGDFVSNHTVSQIHATCSIDYYNMCIQIIKKKIKSPYFFIFSDEPDWARDNIKIEDYDYVTYVMHNKNEKSFQDLQLMSHCKNFIISNSTFSWWAAWLSKHSQKLVLSPKKWFNTDVDTKDLIPETWIKI